MSSVLRILIDDRTEMAFLIELKSDAEALNQNKYDGKVYRSRI